VFVVLSFLLCLIVLPPGLVSAALGVGWLLGWEPRERTVARITSCCFGLGAAAAGGLWLGMLFGGRSQVTAPLGEWFVVEHHRFPLTLMADRLSMPFLALSTLLVGVVVAFSVRYMHREPGFLRFFFLLNLFGFGILLLLAAASFDLLIGGWELVGLTSVLLVAFFQHREEPVRNALRVFAIYRASDVGLLTGVVLMHRYAGSAAFSDLFPGGWSGGWPGAPGPSPGGAGPLAGGAAVTVGLLLLLAAMGKAAQVPFSGWLPRAMEGPTPSSAIFYGALSVHAGAYLLLRAQPLLAGSRLASGAVIVVGLLTALYGTMAGRVAADAKTSLAHASVTQVGLIFVEIGLGWTWLALLHMCGHAAVRTLEFLRAPSMLHDFHHVHAAAGGQLARTGEHYELLLPAPARNWLYRLALDRGHLDTVLDRLLVRPALQVAGILHRWETRWIARAFGPRRRRPLPGARIAELQSGSPKVEGANV
jgi:NADH-quinone oxidoreductase subunit L